MAVARVSFAGSRIMIPNAIRYKGALIIVQEANSRVLELDFANKLPESRFRFTSPRGMNPRLSSLLETNPQIRKKSAGRLGRDVSFRYSISSSSKLQAEYELSRGVSEASISVAPILFVFVLAMFVEVEVNLLTGQTIILRTYIIYDCGQSLNPAVDLGQIEGTYVQEIGFFMLGEYPTNSIG
ncbi:hypothetical protein REPUB_Repub07fG0123500 [Reevesia pubescens]